MAGRFVRASKYRHVFGKGTKKEQCYDNLRISKNAWDTNLIKVSPSAHATSSDMRSPSPGQPRIHLSQLGS
ncbi:hypothetical protein CUC08_Gglean012812 [Alternaria sp. MG1]|nr:hypothetical protein CUC08_Gglean012812 [Alternaria sp. MG1]